MSMFCYQCQETAGGKGCTVRGVCGKNEEVAKLQDLLLYTVKGISYIVTKGNIDAAKLGNTNHEVLSSLFMTITNVNFDDGSIEKQIRKMLAVRDEMKKSVQAEGLHDAAVFSVDSRESMLKKADSVGVLSTQNEDIRSLREMITYGVKGMAAYAEHAKNIGKEDKEIYSFIYEALAATLDDSLSVDDLFALTLKTGEYGVKVMALLDEANTSRFGNPEITEVNIGVRKNPAILVSGHDLTDLEQLLEQTKGTGVDVYTHGEMLPAHYYPAFKKYDNFVGNYGNAWWKQVEEFESFHGPILFTTNCIVPPRSEEVRRRIFTTGSAGFPGCKHIEADENGKKDFSEIIELAKTLPAPDEIETGSIVGGFAHNQVMALADKVVEAVKSGAVKKFFVMAGCDGRMKSRSYYTEFAQNLPKDTVILTAGCAKYRYNKLGLGDIGGIPRVLDAGQCNDSYSLAVIALKLKEVFGLDDINKLPIAFNIAWYEQKAVIVLLALLYLGVKNIHLGPTLPGFLSPNVAKVLVEKFGIAGIGTVEDDIKLFMS
ncbi:MAG TPA: hydroxylamine reductase [Hungateiclostridium thermocellum]|jgi:hydroxylamine reductase|uniref:Hydroxylamine reductase n=2 Tax=Acetivibrio thermocellus TaxID=1515 RepID=HCP_ACET2|nr:hydroxylamine reductase [Acetivibrio thermocellus]A3DBE8.1 RecName: Full=Hydroxylamine reductase; AltName: Full=Hybrid-cluster protein; Short=HCP; AltName: Full=Prismane protein [Acetivibrio thermocellus ATCC 27405]CDG34718.1 Hydroxylamine reductase [Acetivibrio thermocellus BC1]ABN51277.1 hybrid cluster protein [Acetivibrio thermocellus ATCC 27405]ADU75238.1 hybrid cluster protein [Acetivibrio thermocellus DSM 1313]ALX09213.1 Hydroxylamine reductase [Acetivibrio thermocellus AD2]ANV76965.